MPDDRRSLVGHSTSRQYGNGGWYPCPPGKAPWDVRWCCEHDWELHRHDNGMQSWLDWDCFRCGAEAEHPDPPATIWKARRWIAERFSTYGRAHRRHRLAAAQGQKDPLA